MTSQYTTYYDDFTLKSYKELMDGKEVYYCEYNERGAMLIERTMNNGNTILYKEYDEYGRITLVKERKEPFFITYIITWDKLGIESYYTKTRLILKNE